MSKHWKDWDIVITGGDVEKKGAYVYSCLNECAGLPEPEKNIKELVHRAANADLALRSCKTRFQDILNIEHRNPSRQEIRDTLGYLERTIAMTETALAPFEKKK